MQTHINKKAVQASFSKAASQYDQFADLQRETGFRLLALLPGYAPSQVVCSLSSILDLGCGTGYFSSLLSKQNNQANITCFDLSPAMLEQCKQRLINNCQYIEGDVDCLPFAQNHFDLIFSNLVLQWSEQITKALMQLKITLKKDGKLCFSTLLDGSLSELKSAWQKVDDHQHINQFLSEEQVKRALHQAGFLRFTLVTETVTKKYSNVVDVMRALKGIGANHVHHGQKNRTFGRQTLKQLERGYLPHRDENGMYKLSYQVCYVITDS